jgi:hypothetical protein
MSAPTTDGSALPPLAGFLCHGDRPPPDYRFAHRRSFPAVPRPSAFTLESAQGFQRLVALPEHRLAHRKTAPQGHPQV